MLINDKTNVINANQEHAPILTPPRIIRRKPKYIIDIDENILKPMPDKIYERTYWRMANRVWKKYFESLNKTKRCQLIVEMIKKIKF